MYDNPPGSAWWSACKAELDVRNIEQTATALQATSRVLDRMRSSTEHMEQLAQTLSEATERVAVLLDGAKESGRRLEIAVYVLIGVTVVQLFFLTFQVFAKR
jgi:K+/H+ antiporter YhaU regulatory subunit KhtT